MAVKFDYPYFDSEGNAHADLIKYYSDSGFLIKQLDTDYLYAEAVDLYPSRHIYIETNIPMENE